MFVAINNIHANMKGCRKATKLCKWPLGLYDPAFVTILEFYIEGQWIIANYLLSCEYREENGWLPKGTREGLKCGSDNYIKLKHRKKWQVSLRLQYNFRKWESEQFNIKPASMSYEESYR